MESIEYELLNAACNCYDACHKDFNETIEMISNARGLNPKFTEALLIAVRARYSNTKEYQRLRKRLPEEFPI